MKYPDINLIVSLEMDGVQSEEVVEWMNHEVKEEEEDGVRVVRQEEEEEEEEEEEQYDWQLEPAALVLVLESLERW